ncbi:MAG TPA: PQQ-binding-like beta-propeller repeat protein, partial [Vicinamibacterales bacterium]|nr:PQQ-binding-like beta-propeller repeat protein [Vicinamibacterales bacterium]
MRGAVAAWTLGTSIAVAAAGGAPFPIGIRWSVVEAGSRPTMPAVEADAVYLGFERSRLAARALADGSPRWTLDLDLAHAPVTGGGIVFASAPRTLHALEASTGRTRWTRPLALATA